MDISLFQKKGPSRPTFFPVAEAKPGERQPAPRMIKPILLNSCPIQLIMRLGLLE
jgi:hypothetical protein